MASGSAGGEARDTMSGSGFDSLPCMGTDSFDGGFLLDGGGKGGLKLSRMLLGLAGVTTGMCLRRNLRFHRVTHPEP